MLTNLTEGYDCINDYTGKETYSYNAWGQLVNYNNDVGKQQVIPIIQMDYEQVKQ